MSEKKLDDSEVHRTHCCVSHCKYGEVDCPVATGKILPAYECEDCHCAYFHPDLATEAEVWWASLSGLQKRSIYHWNHRSR